MYLQVKEVWSDPFSLYNLVPRSHPRGWKRVWWQRAKSLVQLTTCTGICASQSDHDFTSVMWLANHRNERAPLPAIQIRIVYAVLYWPQCSSAIMLAPRAKPLVVSIYIYIYRIFPLLSACAYISTRRKPALNKWGVPNSEMCLTKNTYIQVHMCVHGHIKGVCPVTRSFVRCTLLHWLEMVLTA